MVPRPAQPPPVQRLLRRWLRPQWPRLWAVSRRIDRFNSAIGRAASWLVLVMLAVGSWNVVGRHLGVLIGHNLSSNALIESQLYLFDLIFLLGAAWTLQRNGHVRVDVLQARWTPRQRALADLLGTVFFLIPFCLLMIGVSWGTVASSWHILEQSPDPGGLPRYPIKTMVPLSFALLALQGISEAIKRLDRLLAPGPSDAMATPDGR